MPMGFYPREPLLKRFFEKVKKTPSCWIWIGGKFSCGYGTISRNDKSCLAHRVSYEEFCGKIPDGYEVCHKCNNKGCVNPDHLYLGTRKENARDASRDGLLLRGQEVSLSKLNPNKIREIRASYKKGKRGGGCYKLAKDFGVHPTTIHRVVTMRTWAHV